MNIQSYFQDDENIDFFYILLKLTIKTNIKRFVYIL